MENTAAGLFVVSKRRLGLSGTKGRQVCPTNTYVLFCGTDILDHPSENAGTGTRAVQRRQRR